jgi:hypothetical protein
MTLHYSLEEHTLHSHCYENLTSKAKGVLQDINLNIRFRSVTLLFVAFVFPTADPIENIQRHEI